MKMHGCGLPLVIEAEDRGIRSIRPVDVAHDQRARLDDAVDHAGIEGVVKDLQRLVEIRERGRQLVGQAIARVDVQLLQLVEYGRQLIGRRNRAARRNRVEVGGVRLAEIVRNRTSVLRPMRGGDA